MAFTLRNLSVLAYANGFTLWHYKVCNDKFEAVSAAGYFADAADLLAQGDMVILTCAEGGTLATVSGEGNALSLKGLL